MASSDFDSSDSDSDSVPLNIVQRILRRNEKLAEKLNTNTAADLSLFDLFSDDDDESDIGFEATCQNDTNSDTDDSLSISSAAANGSNAGPASSTATTTSTSTAGLHHISDSDESLPPTSDDEIPLQGPTRDGRPRTRGRPPGPRRRPHTPPHQWTAQLTDTVPKRFTGPQPGPIGDFSTYSEVETFQLLFTEEFIDKVVELTNLNFQQKKAKSPSKHKMKWQDLTNTELKAWLGVVIGMGLVQLKGDIRSYWSSRHKLTRTVGFPEVFPRDRFLQILRYIHFVDESSAITNREFAGYDKFYKIRYLFQYLVPQFRKVYNPSKHIAVDESMIKGQGRMPARQFMKNKPTRWGLKVFALAESDTGYVLNAELYEGKTSGDAQNPTNVVKKIVQPYRGQGHVIFMDNFYSSVPLFTSLYTDGLMAVGTLREHRKDLPKDTVGKKKELIKKLKRGDSLWRQSNNMYCVTWKDSKVVYMLATVPVRIENEPVIRMTKQDGKWTKIEIQRPTIIGLYNHHMGGVDLADKKIVCYKRQIKGLRWFHKVLWYMMDIAILNSFVIYKKSHVNVRVRLREFREALSSQLIAGNNFRKSGQSVSVDNAIRMNRNLNHAPLKMTSATTCKVHTQRVDTIYSCAVCKIHMCPDPCFARYHYMEHFAYNDPNRSHKGKARKKIKLALQ